MPREYTLIIKASTVQLKALTSVKIQTSLEKPAYGVTVKRHSGTDRSENGLLEGATGREEQGLNPDRG